MGDSVLCCNRIGFSLTETLNKLQSKKIATSFHWPVRLKRKSCKSIAIVSKLESFKQNLTKVTFCINILSHFTMLFKKMLKRAVVISKIYLEVKVETFRFPKKILQLNKLINPPVINHLSSFGALCFRSCFCVQQALEYAGSYKAQLSKV